MTLSSPSVTGELQAIIRMVLVLPAPFGPRKPKASPGAHVEVDAVDGGEAVRVALRQAAGMDEGGLAAHGARHSRPMRPSFLIGSMVAPIPDKE